MDKAARNAIERATQQARQLLDEEFSAQLEGTFDVFRTGDIAPVGGDHLTARQKFQRDTFLAAIERKCATGMTSADAIADYVRDAAFTILNRFVALKMLEARELIQECITRGEQSAGYLEFCGMAPGLALLPDAAGYRLYIESLFDEFSTEIKVLFDRRDAASVLWPKRQTFETLLAILNSPELLGVWGEDETIGWVYQFFNSGEERKRMRDESQAPRNSRELAVRNQFFTPRYVVQFLTDNTLGRLWQEMHGEQTRLTKLCQYLVHSVDEPIQSRPRKDPRDLRILDPACGSGHFLLYSFQLLLTIYEEAWSAEGVAPRSEATGQSLRDDYPEMADLRHAVPRLIVEWNLYGLDIDPRCAQIGALALWLRAQRAWKELDIAASERPRIQYTHIVVAEPMPGDSALVDEFAARLDPPLLRDLFKKMIDECLLAGELGALLRVEDAIVAEVRRAREQFLKQRQTSRFLPGMEPLAQRAALDLSGIDDDLFFQQAEAHIVEALRNFAETATGNANVRRRLFAGDAAQGIALIDILRTRFDVLLMNPPFGQPTPRAEAFMRSSGSDGWKDIYAGFFEVAFRLIGARGLAGAITSSQYFYTRQMRTLRENMVDERRPRILVDLGGDVLDGAAVQTALAVLGPQRSDGQLAYADLFKSEDKGHDLFECALSSAFSVLSLEDLSAIPGKPFCLHATANILTQWHKDEVLDPHTAVVATGNHTFDDERFLRLRYEVNPQSIDSTWITFEKGGEYHPFLSPAALVLQWRQDGAELRALNEDKYGSDAQVMQSRQYWYRAGLCYTHVSSVGFSPRVLPSGVIFSSESIGIFVTGRPHEQQESDLLTLLGFLASTAAQELVWVFGRYRKIENRAVSGIPISFDRLEQYGFGEQARRGVSLCSKLAALDETSPLFIAPDALVDGDFSGTIRQQIADDIVNVYETIDSYADHCLGITDHDLSAPRRTSLVPQFVNRRGSRTTIERAFDLVMWAMGSAFGRWRKGKPVLDPFLGDADALASLPRRSVAASCAEATTPFLVDDEGHALDVGWAITRAISEADSALFRKLLDVFENIDLRDWLRQGLFDYHLSRYRAFKRKAPIYWQLATTSARYSVWIYWHSISPDTLYKVQSECAAEKLAVEERKLESARAEMGNAPTAKQRRALAAQEAFVEEIRAFFQEVKRIAPLWYPSRDDGVLLTMAPLWRLVPQHKSWQNEVKSKWDELAAGKHDWAHLAMHLWPERVVPKCATNRSLAIAHHIEDIFWIQGNDGKWKRRPSPTRLVEELVRERTSAAVKDALKSLVDVPVSSTKGGQRRGRRNANAAIERDLE